jgi:hypothetical protein
VVVADDGLSTSTPKDLYDLSSQDPTFPLLFQSATYAGGAFYLALQPSSQPTVPGFKLLRVQSDGSPTGTVDVPTGTDFDAVVLAAGAADLRVFLESLGTAGSSLLFQRVDLNGVPSAPAVMISPDYYWPMGAVGFGDDTVVLVAKTDAASNVHVALTRLGPSGEVVTPVHEMLSGVWGGVLANGFARRGSDVVAAPVLDQAGRVVLTRVTP